MNSNGRPKISVAMATYNGEKYIREQLESLARQSLLPMELVITDDGSTDATLHIVDDFARTAPFPVRAFRNEKRLGFADNFLKAASLCRGDLIAFCDQDDIWMERKLEVCSRFFVDPKVLLAIHSGQIQVGNEIRDAFYPYFKRTKRLDTADPYSVVPGFAMVIRSSLLHLASPEGRPQRVHNHDQWLWLVAASAGRIVTIREPLVLYRQHDKNALGAPPQLSAADNLRRTAKAFNYDEFADFELECSCYLLRAAEQSAPYAARLKKSAKRLALRSKLHRLRTQIYREDSTLWGRARVFLSILGRAGYLPDSSNARLGPRAAAKDMLLGVSGTFKRIRR